MIFSAVGVGPGDRELVTIKAVRVLERADLVLIPLSSPDRNSVSEGIVAEYIENSPKLRMVFPMTKDAAARDAMLEAQLNGSRELWQSAERIAMPVIGDAALYATSAYLYDIWKKLVPSLELEIVPGISAHAAISSRLGRLLALGDDILTVIPCTGDAGRIARALIAADSAALFKPIALGGELREVVEKSGPWREMMRVDRAGLPDEKIYRGDEALEEADEYLSTLMLWR